ncbi:MAG: 4Fe-4S ferredoxin, partial [Desulfuromonadales bacterium]|nr:4Fe-4S ferredoxin [Desulfuromonadales bacterium]NIS43184.1 4Fe-4S ferredoxin [Desulfuromonadales bacterium]
MAEPDDKLAWAARLVRDFWKDSSENTLHLATGEKAWDEPLIGVARGDDPLFARIKADLGDFYWTPPEAFALAWPETPAPAKDLSVIVWVLPQTEDTRREQRAETRFASERWARSRDYGERFNCALRLHMARVLTEAGHPAVAAERLPGFAYRRSQRFGLASNWSERHTAHIAGLGTFGLSDGLITPRGKAVRIGSVVARIDLPSTPRPYSTRHEWCLWYANGSCGACMKRCPAAAIAPSGHDKDACHTYIREVTA